jgi:zinc transporter 1/2/3
MPFVLMGALAIHAIFEGIATGLATDFSICINMCISIWLHKFAASMSISVAMQKNEFPFKMFFGLISIFSLATPIGVGIGIIVS